MLKTKSTPVAAALARPVPAGIATAAAAVKAAEAALQQAQALADAARRHAPPDAEAIERELAAASVRLEMARLTGEDTVAAVEEIDRLRQRRTDAVAARDGHVHRVTALADEVERRSNALTELHDALGQELGAWTNTVVEAADRQMAMAVDLAEEARRAMAVVKPEVGTRSAYSEPRYPIFSPGRYAGTGRHEAAADLANVPAAIDDAAAIWARMFRILER